MVLTISAVIQISVEGGATSKIGEARFWERGLIRSPPKFSKFWKRFYCQNFQKKKKNGRRGPTGPPTSRVTNKSITVFTTTNIITESGTVTTNLFTVTTKYSTVTEIDIVIQQVMEFFGMGNWEQVHTFAAVCKFWRHSSLPHLYNIGKVPMDGGAERRLNVAAFLRFLQSEHFRNVQCIFIPCRKTKCLFVNDIKASVPKCSDHCP